MKKLVFTIAFLATAAANAQVGVGTVSPDASAALEIESTSSGILIPRMTTTERDAISSPATGLMVFNTTSNSFEFYNGTAWGKVSPDVDESKWALDVDSAYVNLAVQSNGASRPAAASFVVTDAGQVGIGNSSPVYDFQIGNVISLDVNTNDRWANLIMNPKYNSATKQYAVRVDGGLREVYHYGIDRTADGSLGSANANLFMRLSLDAPVNSFRMNSVGNTALGGTPNTVYKLLVYGDLRANGTVYSNSTALTSDARLKSNIETVRNGLDLLSKLNPVHYSKRSVNDSTSVRNEYGFIAQEVRELMPELVFGKESDSTYLSLDYNSFIAILTRGVQEQQATIESQQNQLDALNERLSRLEAAPENATASFGLSNVVLIGGLIALVLAMTFRSRYLKSSMS